MSKKGLAGNSWREIDSTAKPAEHDGFRIFPIPPGQYQGYTQQQSFKTIIRDEGGDYLPWIVYVMVYARPLGAMPGTGDYYVIYQRAYSTIEEALAGAEEMLAQWMTDKRDEVGTIS
jgi:hypothetical protein